MLAILGPTPRQVNAKGNQIRRVPSDFGLREAQLDTICKTATRLSLQSPENVAGLGKFDCHSLLPAYRRADTHDTCLGRFPCVSIGQLNFDTHRRAGFDSQYRTMGADYLSHPVLLGACSVPVNPCNFYELKSSLALTLSLFSRLACQIAAPEEGVK